MTEEERERMSAYIGRAACGCVRAIIVDNPEHRRDTAREIAGWVRDGLSIERTTVMEARRLTMSCPHRAAKAPRRQRAEHAIQLKMEAADV